MEVQNNIYVLNIRRLSITYFSKRCGLKEIRNKTRELALISLHVWVMGKYYFRKNKEKLKKRRAYVK